MFNIYDYNWLITISISFIAGYSIILLDRWMNNNELDKISSQRENKQTVQKLNKPDKTINIRSFAWKYSHEIKIGITLSGHSRAAERTCFFWNELSIYFDAGLQSYKKGLLVLLTHGHADHSASLSLMDIEFRSTPIQIMVPEEVKEQATSYIDSLYRLNDATTNLSKYNMNLTPVNHGDKFIVELKSRPYEIQIFKCNHNVPTVGYGISEVKNKLKQEYRDLPGTSIRDLKKDGVNIYREIITPIMIYLGDTKADVLDNKEIFKYPVIMIECTFFDDETEDEALYKSHVHWNHLIPYVKEHPETTFVLYHFSARYREHQITEFFENIEKKEKINNIYVWLG